jgi:FKBP-type peptidyl-prolyl cis-trans isomerase FkpA
MATPKSQRIGIWIIAIVLGVGTLGSFLVMGISASNQNKDQQQLQAAYNQYNAQVTAQTTELSNKYYADFNQYASIPAAFNTSDIKSVTTSDLKVGDGAVITADTEYNAYYIGWNPKGVVFDESIASGALKAPISGSGLIAGWTEGVTGMKIGGVREISIPSDKAYGAAGSGDNIPANTPIKFIVMAIPKIADIPVPEILQQYYQSQSQ